MGSLVGPCGFGTGVTFFIASPEKFSKILTSLPMCSPMGSQQTVSTVKAVAGGTGPGPASWDNRSSFLFQGSYFSALLFGGNS